jgi:hypothetical protein
MTTSEAMVTSTREFARLQNQLAVATERFNQATQEKEGLLAFIGTLETITSEDRQEFQEQIETEQEAYEAIKELHDKVIRLLREDNQAVKTIKRRLRLTIVDGGKPGRMPHLATHTTIVGSRRRGYRRGSQTA